jgi:hypothetical protein
MRSSELRPNTQKFKGYDRKFTSRGARNPKRDGFISYGPGSRIENGLYVHLYAVRVLLVGICLSLILSRSAKATPPLGYKLVFADEFNGPLQVASGTGWGPIVSPIKWIAHTPYGGDFGNAYFIHFYIDGVEVANTPTLPEEALPLYVMVDLALGDGFPIDIPSPTRMYVDYIRAYAP